MTSYFTRSASFQGIANLPKSLQTKGIRRREAGQRILGPVGERRELFLKLCTPRLRETVIENEFREAFSRVYKETTRAGHPLSKIFF